MAAKDLPIACSLDAVTLGRRQSELRASVLVEAQSTERLATGYRWRFRGTADLFSSLGPMLDAERQCCRFLHVSIDAEPDLGTITLEVTGPTGTADFLESWITPPPTEPAT